MSGRPDLDLTVSRVIRAPRQALWEAWTDPKKFEQWWIPKPMVLRVVEMDIRPGGAMSTEMSEDGKTFQPHLDACFLEVEPQRRLVWTTLLTGGWRPIEPFFQITAVISFNDRPDGVEYHARVMHRNETERQAHADMGFQDGWGTVADQLAALVEG